MCVFSVIIVHTSASMCMYVCVGCVWGVEGGFYEGLVKVPDR